MKSPRCPKCDGRLVASVEHSDVGQLQVVGCQQCGWRTDRPMVSAPETTKARQRKSRKYAVVCSEPGCAERAICRGMCKKHYSRWAYRRDKETDSPSSAADLPVERLDPEEMSPPSAAERVARAAGKVVVDGPRVAPKLSQAVRNHKKELTVRFFEADLPLLDRLRESAETNRRALSSEVLCRLEASFPQA